MSSTAATFARPNLTGDVSTGTRDYLTPEERQEREAWKAKLRQRVQFQQIARNLRAKLQYAAYKVRHNVTHLTLEELEARQEAATAHVPNWSTNGHAFVAPAAFGTATPDLQRRGYIASPTSSRPTRAQPSSFGRTPRSAADGAHATQSLYASILAQPPPRRDRKPSNLVRHGTSRPRRDHRDGDSFVAERTCESRSIQVAASSSSSKRKALASAPRNKVSKRKQGDDAAGASRHDDEDWRAAAMLTHLFRDSRTTCSDARTIPGPVFQISHLSDHTDMTTGQLSLDDQLQQRRARTRHALAGIPPHIRPITAPHVATSPMQRKITGGPSAAASTISSTQHLAATGSTSTRASDYEAVQLLHYLHGHPSSARSQASVAVHESGALDHDAVASRALVGEKAAPIFDVHANRRAAFLCDGASSGSATDDPEPAPLVSARLGLKDMNKPGPNVHYLPPQLRRLTRERTAVADVPSPAHEAEVALPIICVTPPL